ncbi:uncharacterized protein K460DRAFT_351909 [Cucurbitaria berberidis CBS 394.84]|uniref:Uncharacterized protein n=1 Tax=Cucurbitaria berberidis CBS 394.84 TaxID=1168544 RepID=A0A9P4GUH6_9PLEO|nr:uncharacterized protein K460DRAFT_351909 [Cucurbitaria berberidis CBS 394.84]KAF1852062.1 hypothetical protein K460DRAFT_351909 [Cucurbitaria berberidis CBS 394.84]
MIDSSCRLGSLVLRVPLSIAKRQEKRGGSPRRHAVVRNTAKVMKRAGNLLNGASKRLGSRQVFWCPLIGNFTAATEDATKDRHPCKMHVANHWPKVCSFWGPSENSSTTVCLWRILVPQRPRLSINTQQTRILGKSASLRLETLSAVSPTIRNTFSNAYEQPSTAPALERPSSKPRLSIDSNFSDANSASTPNSASTLSSTLTSASNDSATLSIPYKQPHNLASILANSPARALLPRKMTPARPMFPAEKRVSFRTPLEEEIKTIKYTLAHSDLESSSSTLDTIESTSTPESNHSDASAVDHSLSHSASPSTTFKVTPSPPQLLSDKSPLTLPSLGTSPPRSPQAGEKRDSSSSEDDSDCPETPVAGRRKRRREWQWTLSPLPGSSKLALASGNAAVGEESSQYLTSQ